MSVRDIDYVEVVNTRCSSTWGDRVAEAWTTLYKVTEELEKYGFALCNACYLVNLSHVKGVKDDAVFIADTQLKISRPKRKEFMEKLILSHEER